MTLLELISEKKVDLPEIHQSWTWAIIDTFRLAEPATSDEYVTALIAWAPRLKDFYFGDAHGPYRLDALTSSDYVACSADEAEGRFSEWISEFCGPKSTDPERIMSEIIRPHLTGSDLFALTGAYDERERLYGSDDKAGREASRQLEDEIWSNNHAILDPAAGQLMGWIEIVAINRSAETLTMIITSAD